MNMIFDFDLKNFSQYAIFIPGGACMFGRVIVKISGEGLAGAGGGHFDENAVGDIADQVLSIISAGTETALVVGGGNFWRGRDRREGMDKVRADQMGMLGTIMNGIYLTEVFRMKGGKAHVMTPFAVNGFTEVYNRELALSYMRAKEPVIFAGGTGHPFFSTDSIVALRACELNARAVLYGKTVDGVYDKDPKIPGARKYRAVSYKTVVENDLHVADIPAIALTQEQGISSVVFKLLAPNAIAIACENNEKIHTELGGTLVSKETEDIYYA
jgi:uridylate kinase